MNKKLLITLAIVGTASTMTLAGCDKPNKKPGVDTPIVAPISDIVVTKPTEDIVVGDVINLDAYISVVGGTGPAAYDVTVRPVSADVVSIKGHEMTVLKEGKIALKVSAGDEEALVSWESLSKIKSDYKQATKDIDKHYAMLDANLSATATGYSVSLTGEGLLHSEEYYYQAYVNSSDVLVGEGSALLSDGNIYDFEAENGFECNNLEFLPGPTAGYMWDYYFVNMGFAASYDVVSTITEVDEDSGEEYSYLGIPAADAVPAGMEDYAANLADYVTLCTFGSSVKLLQKRGYLAGYNAKTTTMDIEALEFSDGTTAYLMMSYVYKTDGSAATLLGRAILDPTFSVKSVEDYIASGDVPEALPCTEATAFMGKLSTATSYVATQQVFSVTDAGTVLEPADDNVTTGVMTQTYDEAHSIIVTQSFDSDSNLAESYGYAVSPTDSKLYFFKYDAETKAYSLKEQTGVTFAQVKSLLGAQTAAAAFSADNVMVMSRKVDEGTSAVSVVLNDTTANGDFVMAFLSTVPYGSTFTEYSGGYTQYADTTITVSADGNTMQVDMDVPVAFKTFTPKVSVVYSNLGAADASSILSTIFTPAA